MTTWLPLSAIAPFIPNASSLRHARRLAASGALGNIKYDKVGRRANALLVDIESGPAVVRANYYAAHPHLAPRSRSLQGESHEPKPPIDFDRATPGQKHRARLREAAVIRWQIFIEQWGNSRGITAAKQRWVDQFKLEQASKKPADRLTRISVDSIERWTTAYLAYNIAGLIDGNDGSARRKKTSIPRAALNVFLARCLDKNSPPTIARAIEETRMEFGCLYRSNHPDASCRKTGCRLPHADDPFYRWWENHVDPLVKEARREAVDSPSTFLPFVGRSADRPYRTLQSDHHIADVFVNCEGESCSRDPRQAAVECRGHGTADPNDALRYCDDRTDCRIYWCRGGHRPWLTPIMDVGSRCIVSHQISLEVPNAERILRALYLAILKEGLPERFYCDNGKDFKKAAGWKLSAEDDEHLGRGLRTLGVTRVFARPYNAQAKSIERWFRTLIQSRCEGSYGYTGASGKKRPAHTKRLCDEPHRLMPFSQFAQMLGDAIDIYNTANHRGVGMNGRSPAQVLASADRIPRRNPDEFAFKLVFWQTEERTVDRRSGGYGVRHKNLVYTLIDPDGSIASTYFKQRVKLLIDPDDVSRAIVCNLDEQFLCEAWVLELATHDTRDVVTQEVLARTERIKKVIRRRLATSPAAAGALRRLMAAYPSHLRRVAQLRREEQQRLVAAGGSTVTTFIPSYSKIARDVEAFRAATDPLAGLSSADRALIESSSAPVLTGEQLDQFLADAEKGSYPTSPLRAVGSGESSEERARVERERRRVRREQKARRGECVVDNCEARRTRVSEDAEECGRHWLELYGDDLDPEVRAHFRQLITEEEQER